MSSYSCLSCRVSFINSDLQRSHYKSNWHRYNLKRKVASLPPITQELFEEKLLQQKAEAEDKKKDTSRFCNVCNKSFTNAKAFDNHMSSKKHKSVEAKSGGCIGHVEVEQAKKKSDCEEELSKDKASGSVSVEQSLHHMTKSHSFFIPDIDYITELENFIVYLGAKVGDGKICLYCNKKSPTFQTVDAVRKHMRDKGHCMVDFEGDNALEYSDFYDFSSSYSNFDPETDDIDDDTEVQQGTLDVDEDTMELVLPSGSRAGHRAFKHYYNQSIPPAHLQRKKERAMIKGLNVAYKSLGWHGTVSQATRQSMSATRTSRQQGQRRDLKLGLKANKFQPHLRPQVIF
eukprot:gene3578-4082_t